MANDLTVKITKVVNYGEFLQTTATVIDGKNTKDISYCHKSLPFNEIGVLNALLAVYNAPPYIDPIPDPNIKPIDPPVDPGSIVPNASRIAKVKVLEDVYKALPKPVSITTATSVILIAKEV